MVMNFFYALVFLISVTFMNVAYAQDFLHIDEVSPKNNYENIYVEKLYGDSLSTGFLIWVKDTVKTHRHNWHSESIVVLEGEAKMYVNDSVKMIRSGELLFIPKNTWHSVKVTSEIPLKVISVQSPGFYGEDREFKDENNE
jgi:mannose-6-phosphate isomerase-like protein (cupin superfamily)